MAKWGWLKCVVKNHIWNNKMPYWLILSIIMSANSGIKWIDQTFDFCVQLLIDVAHIFGITYEEINVWIFCVIWPILSLIMFVEIIRLKSIIKLDIKDKIKNNSTEQWKNWLMHNKLCKIYP